MIVPLFEGPLDIIGDVHGEIGPLRQLLHGLGYTEQGAHPENRRLVFVGDLVDRGPDSPAVLQLVRDWVCDGRAQCVLGNHELNLLREDQKPGNRWFLDPDHAEQLAGGHFAHSRPAPVHLRSEWREFFAGLPVALERTDLRVVHAAWVPDEIAVLRREAGSVLEVFDRFEANIHAELEAKGLILQANQEGDEWADRLHVKDTPMPLLTATAECEEQRQMGNPVRVATSGVERKATSPFWAEGKWRMCRRVRWWDEYQDDTPVVVGHYWRRALTAPDGKANTADLFAGTTAPQQWVGRGDKVFCVDFSIGARYRETHSQPSGFDSHIAALRWPERELWFETGRWA
jgi:hypothetical protein